MRKVNEPPPEAPGPAWYTVVTTTHDEVVTPYQSQALAGDRATNVILQDKCPSDPFEHVTIVGDPVAIQWTVNALERPGAANPRFEPDCTGATYGRDPDDPSAGAGAGGSGPPAAGTPLRVSLARRAPAVKRRRAGIRLSCHGPRGAVCAGRLELRRSGPAAATAPPASASAPAPRAPCGSASAAPAPAASRAAAASRCAPARCSRGPAAASPSPRAATGCAEPPRPRGSGHVRLRDRRRRLSRLRPRQPPVRGPGRLRLPRRGRPSGHRGGPPHPGGVLPALQDALRLGLRVGAGGRARRSQRLPPARSRARRLLVAQRDDLHPRQPPRLRRVARPRQRRLGLGRRPALLHARGGQRARRLGVPRRRRPAVGLGLALDAPARRRLRRGGQAGRARGPRRLQHRRAGRRRPLPADPAQRHALLDRGRLPAPRADAAQRHADPDGARDARAVRRLARVGRRGRGRGRGDRARGRARGDPVRGRLPVAAAADALGHRAGRRARRARRRGAPRPARGRRQPAGPPERGDHPLHRRPDHARDGRDGGERRAAAVAGARAADLQHRRVGRLLALARRARRARRAVPLRAR